MSIKKGKTKAASEKDMRWDMKAKKKRKTQSKEDASDYNKRYMVKPHCYCTLLFLPLSLALNW